MTNRSRKTRLFLDAFKQALARRKNGRRTPLSITSLEDRLVPAGDLVYPATADGAVTLRLTGPDVQVVDPAGQVLAFKPLAEITDGVRVEANNHNVDLTIDASLPQVPGGVLFAGGSKVNKLFGPAPDTTWHLTGPGSGDMGGPGRVRFQAVEQLVGAADNEDTFVIAPGGTLSDGVDGGGGGSDRLLVQGSYQNVQVDPTDDNSGTVLLGSMSLKYTGVEPIDLGPGTNVTVIGNPILPNDLVLERDPVGRLQVRSLNNSMPTISFDDPASLVIRLGLLNDTLTVNSTIGYNGSLDIDGKLGDDRIVVAHDVILPGHDIRLAAETIDVQGNVRILADVPPGPGVNNGRVELIAEVESLSGLSPIDVFPTPDPKITVDTGAVIKGGAVSLTARKVNQTAVLPFTLVSVQSPGASVKVTGATIEGDDVRISATSVDETLPGVAVVANNFAIQQAINALGTFIPTMITGASVMIREATSEVTIENARITSRGDVAITSDTGVASETAPGGGWDPTKKKSSVVGDMPISVGYAEATGTSRTKLTGSTSISAAGDVRVSSDTETVAEVKAGTFTNTSPREGSSAHKNTINKKLSFGIALALTTSKTTAETQVGGGVTIESDGHVDVTAHGNVRNHAQTRTAVFIDGSVGTSVSIASDKADIKSRVDGTIHARSISTSEDREALTFSSIDPDTNVITQAEHGLQDGQELLYLAENPDNPAEKYTDPVTGLMSGQVYRVVVLDANRFQLVKGAAIQLDASEVDANSVQTLSRREVLDFDPTTRVDDATNEIRFSTPHKLTEGQRVEYYVGTREGAVVTGLSNQSEYVVHKLDDLRIQLLTANPDDPAATTTTVPIGGKTYYVLNLAPPAAASGTITFDPTGVAAAQAAEVNVDADTIAFSADHNFTTGQRVTYSPGAGSTAIGGLPAGTYYAIKLDRNVLQLATSALNAENKVAIDLKDGAAGTTHSFHGERRDFLAYHLSAAQTPLDFNPQAAVGSDGAGGKITFTQDHGLQTGDAVVYRTDASIRKDVGVTTVSQIPLADVVQTFNPAGVTANGELVIDAATDAIVVNVAHNFVSGQRVTYSTGGGLPIRGLDDGGSYYVIADPDAPDRFRLATRDAGNPNAIPGPVMIAGQAYYVLDIAVGSATGNVHSLRANAVDAVDNVLVVPGHSFFTGQQVDYHTAGGTPVSSGLNDGGTYYVIRIDDNRLRLATSRTGPAVTLGTTGTGTAHNLVTKFAVTPFDAARTAPVVHLGNDTIELPAGHGLLDGDTVTYTSGDGQPIGGLADGTSYKVVLLAGNRIQLKDGSGNVINLLPGATAGFVSHAFEKTGSPLVEFDPTLLPTVDAAADTIWKPGHAFRAGERITYLTAGETAIGGLTAGHDYFVIPGPTAETFRLADADNPQNDPTNPATLIPVNLTGAGAGIQGFERAARAVQGDSPIAGLEDGEIYYVTRVDARTIRLSETRTQAEAAAVADLDVPASPPAATAHTLVVPGDHAGIHAGLDAKNTVIATAGIGGLPTLSDWIAGNVTQDPKTLFAVLTGSFFMGIHGRAIPVSVSASVGVNAFDHTVRAEVGPAAVLTSDTDLAVNAEIKEKVLGNVDATVTTENAPDGKRFASALGIMHGSYTNSARAIVEGGASLDARGKTAVTSDVKYPLLVDNLVGASDVSLDSARGAVTEELETLMNRTGGLTRLMNTWVATSGRAPDADVTITGSGADVHYTNDSQAIIQPGAKVNQNPAFQNPAQSVEVTAKTEMELINVAGVVHAELNESGLMQAIRGGYVARPQGNGGATWRSAPLSPFGNQAGVAGLGGSVLLQAMDNTTIAKVDGAQFRTGDDGLTVEAKEDVFTFDFAQTGGTSNSIGVAGSTSIVDQISKTVAQLRGAKVTGGPVEVTAGSEVDHLNLTGAVQVAKEIGLGTSVGITNLQRDTVALVGARPEETPRAGDLDVSDLTVKATATGEITGIGVAGVLIADVPLASYILNPPVRPGAATGANFPPLPIALGASGASAVNAVKDTTQAIVNDPGTIKLNDGDLKLESRDETTVQAVTGASALVLSLPVKAKGPSAAFGLAGSFGQNTLEMTTEAFVAGTEITEVDAATLDAVRTGDVSAVSAGISGTAQVAPGVAGAGAAAGSVTINAIKNATRAYLDNADLTADGPVSLTSGDTSVIDANVIGGSGAVGTTTGGVSVALAAAGSVALNSIDNTVESLVRNNSVVDSEGDVTLKATDDASIEAVSGALAVGLSFAAKGVAAAGAIGVSVAVNDIGKGAGSAVRAVIDDSTVTADGDVTLDARSTAEIASLALAGAAAGSAGTGIAVGFGGAGAGTRNTIDVEVEAAVRNTSTVITTAGGDVILTAKDGSQIDSYAGGAALAVAVSQGLGAVTGAVGAAVALNTINNTVRATVDNSTVNAAGDVELTAASEKVPGSTADYRIDAMAFGRAVAGSVTLGSGLTGSLAGAGSAAINKVDNIVEATTKSAAVTAGGDVDLSASDDSSIRSDAGGYALSVAAALGGVAAAAAFSASYSENLVGKNGGHAVRALIEDSTVQADGVVALDADSTAVINAQALGGTIAVGGGLSPTNASIAGAGAATLNTIAATVEAGIAGGIAAGKEVIARGGDVTIHADDRSEIEADAGGASLAFVASLSGTNVAVSAGAAVAKNTVTNTDRAFIDGAKVTASGKVDVATSSAAADGEMLNVGAVSTTAVTIPNHGLETGDRVIYHATGAPIGGLADGHSYFVVKVNNNAIRLVETRAETLEETPTPIALTPAGGQHRLEKPRVRIDARAVAAAAAVGANVGGIRLTASGAGAAAVNAVDNKVESYARNSQVNAGTPGVALTARDDSTIRADVGGFSVALAAGVAGVSGALSVGASLAQNDIGGGAGHAVRAYVENSTVDTPGDLILDAVSDAEINALSAGGSLTGAASAFGIAVGGAAAGSASLNSIGQDVEAVVRGGSSVTTDGDIRLAATDNSTITADAGAVAAAVAFSVAGPAVGFSVGLALSTNDVQNTTVASIDGSTAAALGDVTLDATSTAAIDALTFGGAAALSGSVLPAVAAAASGAVSLNDIDSRVEASLVSSTVSAPGDSVTLDATDAARIYSVANGGSVAFAGSPAPNASLSLAVVTARNEIGTQVIAAVADSAVTAADVAVAAATLPESNITSQAIAAAVSGASGTVTPFSAVISGAGALAENDIDGGVRALVSGSSEITATGPLTVSAKDAASIDSVTGAGGLAFGLVGASIGASTNRNQLDRVVSASVDGKVTSGDLSILAESTSRAEAESVVTSVALTIGGAGAGSEVTTTVGGSVGATVRPTADVHAGKVLIRAGSDYDARATTHGVAVGLVGVGVALADAVVGGVTLAQIDDGAKLTATNGLTVEAVGTSLAAARAEAASGGIFSGRGADAEADVRPTILATVGGGAVVTVTGNAVVKAETFDEGDARAVGRGGGFIDVGVSLADVEVTPNVSSTVDASAKLTATGNVAVTATSGRAGSTAGQSGSEGKFEPTEDVDLDADTIHLDDHRLRTSDEVVYDRNGHDSVGGLSSGRTYHVIVQDQNTLRLGNAFAGSAVDGQKDVIVFAGPHGFVDGDRVRYQRDGDDTGLSEDEPYIVKVIDARTIKLTPPVVVVPLLFEPTAVNSGANTFNFPGHSFQNNQPVTYRAPAPFEFSSLAVDIVVKADGTPDLNDDGTFKYNANANTIYVKNHGFATGQAVAYRRAGTGTAIGNLPNGTYYVRVLSADVIQLALTQAGATGTPGNPNATPPVPPTDPQLIELVPATGTLADKNTVHTIAPAGDKPIGPLVDGRTYYVVNRATDTFQLAATPGGTALDLDAAGVTGFHSIGTEGIDLTPGEGTHTLRFDLTSQPDGEHLFTGPGGVPLGAITPTAGDGVSSVSATGSSGKFGGTDINKATLHNAPVVRARADGNITADGNVAVGANSTANVSGHVDNGTGGFVAIGRAEARVDIDNDTLASVGPAAVIVAGGAFALTADAHHLADVSGHAGGGGFAEIGEIDTLALIDYTTRAVVGDGARVTATGGLRIDAATATDKAKVTADVDVRGLGANADANDNGSEYEDADSRGVRIGRTNADTDTVVGNGAVLTGGTVELTARVPKIDADSISRTYAGAFAADSDTLARVEAHDAATVTIESGAQVTGLEGVAVRALIENVDAAALSLAGFDGVFGDTDAVAISYFDLSANVVAQSGALITTGPGTGNRALDVEARVNPFDPNTEAANDKGLFDGGNEDEKEKVDTAEIIDWDADVTVLSGPAPRLLIGPNGDIVEAVNVTVNGGQQAGTVTGDISVDDITNTRHGDVVFVAEKVDGSGALFTFQDTLGAVTIENQSAAQNLIVNDVSMLVTDQPLVLVDSPDVGLTFDIDRAVGPTDVTITNAGSGDIQFNGLVDNPIGTTTVLNSGGDIVSTATGVVRTNQLDVEATAGNVEGLNVELVTSFDRPPVIEAEAGGDLSLNLKARQRSGGSSASVPVALLRAGGDVDVALQPSVQDPAGSAGSATSVQVSTPRDTTPDGLFHTHYFPDSLAVPVADRGFFANTAAATPIPSTYQFALIEAGHDINVHAVGPNAPRLDISGTTDVLPGDGQIDVHTNGSINLTERAGDMPVGSITSDTSDVTLISAGSILDAEGDSTADVTGTDLLLIADTTGGGTIGTATDHLDIDSSHAASGKVSAAAPGDVYLRETAGDMNVAGIGSLSGDANLIADRSILDAEDDPSADVLGRNVTLTANTGSIGAEANDLEIDTAASGPGVLVANAQRDVYITEATTEGDTAAGLNVLTAVATTGDVRLTVPDLAGAGHDLHVVDGGQVRAAGSVTLRAGDNLDTTASSTIAAGTNIDLVGDYENADPGVGTTIDLRGSITPGTGADDRAAVFGNSDNDTITFDRTNLGGQTFAYGADGQDTFTVNQLQSMTTSRPLGSITRRDTLDLDGQAGTDTYVVHTTGSTSATPSDYVINVLDTGADDNGADVLTVDGSDVADLFLLRKADTLVGRPAAESPAFVALLHGTLAQAQSHTLDSHVERINYDANIDGGLTVNTLAGNDHVAGDDNSTTTTIDGGTDDDSFQIGQMFGTARVPDDVALPDQFSTLLTTRGHLSRGVSSPTAVRGGDGNDTFQVYSNGAELQLAGEAGDDTFVVRAFALPDGGFNLNAPVGINGGTGTDQVVAIGTEIDDNFAITAQGIFGSGLHVSHDAVEGVEVDGLEGNDKFFVLSTRAGVATKLVAGAGSDTASLTGDVTEFIVQGLVTTPLPEATHTTDQVQGPVTFEGFNGDTPVRTIDRAVILPGESDPGPFQGPPPPADDRAHLDRVNVFNDRSATADTGTLTGTTLTGLNMAGLTYRAVEVLDVMLGTNDDRLTVNSTLTADGVQNPTAPAGQQGGITLVQGGGGDDTLTVNGGGGPASPLVLYGDTAQDGVAYSGSVGTPSPYATAYPAPGNDVIDARNATSGVIAYGGGGNDTVHGSQGDDLIAGGSGDDVLSGQAGNDLVHGDDGINVDPVTRTVTVPTVAGTIAASGDDLAAGSDRITGDAGTDVVFGDHGIVTQLPGTLPVLTTGNVTRVETTNAADGLPDTIDGGTGHDSVLGGHGGDAITDATGENVLFGDFGYINRTPANTASPIDSLGTLNPELGGNDSIAAGLSDTVQSDIVFGGSGGDSITAGNGPNNIVLGDSGEIQSATPSLAAPLSGHHITLGQIATTDAAHGGNDSVTTGTGSDIVLAGPGGDAVAAGDGTNVVFGDQGVIEYATDGDARDIDSIASADVTTGGNDAITTGAGDDIVLGGSGSDTVASGDGQGLVFGDSGQLTAATGYDANAPFAAHAFQLDTLVSTQSPADGNDQVTSGSGSDIAVGGAGNDSIATGAGNDLAFGAYGRVNTLTPTVPVVPSQHLPTLDPALGGTVEYTAILTQDADLQGNPDNDAIDTGDGADIALGQQGNDSVQGGTGDDDLIGGSNVAGAQDGADVLDGGAGADVIAGDNAIVGRRFDSVDPRFVGLNAPTIYDVNGNLNADLTPRTDPTGGLHRNITLLDISDAPLPGTFGNDTVAGGADNDEIFGELGDDTVQGDGSTASPFGAVRAADGTIVVTPAAEAATDGGDYIEGNGGNDTLFGGLGQDDLVGGSSNLFGQTTAALRPDGEDAIYGGSGAAIARDNAGDTSATGHARDADHILGDNGNIHRLLGADGQFLKFNYDNYDPSKLIPRGVTTLDYTPAVAGPGDIGNADYLHGESGDDFVHGQAGNDVLFGEGQDDQLIGGAGHDRIYSGTGEDAVLGDDGRFAVSRNGLTEPLYGVTAVNPETYIALPGPFTGAWVNITGRLDVTPKLMVPTQGGNDLVYGGRGDDFLHAGAGDDGVSGAEAQAAWYNDRPVGQGFFQAGGYAVTDPTSPLGYDPATRKLAAYDANNPLTKVNNFFLNFDAANGSTKIDDGKDRLFGDDGHDWLVGGTQNDRLFGGKGDDQHNADDNHDTNGGLNNGPDAAAFADRDFVYGGDGLDVMIANTGGDRLFDWGGEFNTFVVPFATFGAPTVNRAPNPAIQAFLLALGDESGADQTLTEPNGELGLFTQSDPQWQANHGAPRDPQPGTVGGVSRDTQGAPEDDRAGSAPPGEVTVDRVFVSADPSNPSANALFVGGTNAGDTIVVQRGTTAAFIHVVINGVDRGQFPVTTGGASIGRIIVYGNAGNDNITVNTNVGAIDTVLYGGAGNDTVVGGAGSAFIDGGDGNDRVTATGSRNVLIGGLGQDTLTAGQDDDILIGGSFILSEDLDAVRGVTTTWKSSASYAARVADIRTGGLYAMTPTTVRDDGVSDLLTGSQGQDWFWSYQFDQDDRRGGETNR